MNTQECEIQLCLECESVATIECDGCEKLICDKHSYGPPPVNWCKECDDEVDYWISRAVMEGLYEKI